MSNICRDVLTSEFEATVALIFAEIDRQDELHPQGFPPTRAGVRSVIAAAQDELGETYDAWRAERRIDGWPTTHLEAVQTAAVLLRGVLAMQVWGVQRTGTLPALRVRFGAIADLTLQLRDELCDALVSAMETFVYGDDAEYVGADRDGIRRLLDVAEDRIATARRCRKIDVEQAGRGKHMGRTVWALDWQSTCAACFDVAVVMAVLSHVTRGAEEYVTFPTFTMEAER